MLAAKEGLALINGTQVFDGARARRLLPGLPGRTGGADYRGALHRRGDGFVGSLHRRYPQLRGHKGQIDTAAALRRLLAGSVIRESHLEGDERVQDPYCIRCQPQVDGACLDLLRMAGRTLEIEANAVTDNPLVLSWT